jgi:hypothetical protein
LEQQNDNINSSENHKISEMEKLSREREKEVLDFKDQQVNDFINVK